MSTVCVGKSFGWASLVCLTTEAVRLSKRKSVFKVLKDFPNKDLEKQVKEAETENQKKQLEDKLNSVKKTVSDTQKQLDGKHRLLAYPVSFVTRYLRLGRPHQLHDKDNANVP